MLGQREIVAKNLLDIHAVTLRPDHPFVWPNGMKTPLNTDSRYTISYPYVRRNISVGLTEQIKHHLDDVDVIAGLAISGIPHAAYVAERLQKSMIYVDLQADGSQIAGVLEKGQRVVLVVDNLATGVTAMKAIKVIQNAGGIVAGVVAVFDDELPELDKQFKGSGIPYYTVTTLTALLEMASNHHYIDDEQLASLQAWHDDPHKWGEEH
ncbi:orotate phosphoribosyltransferase [Limosilactobacillus secaliphilus]|uniref:Orotate phosphoribosyltransferase n=1 Tax=Limosilactobacillus secaliphilus TaxID=396268 RepID=A0A0R2I0R1_9LACO|nr:orotate phosphoribosyltransferase [Limosilactobacillus secaliphilus]KRN58600.1 orotate phosphoribosyltransferase [Limosilactobacillus secaliphilus]